MDSAVAAILLRKQGFQVQTLFVRMTGSSRERAAQESAARISEKLGLPFHTQDMQETFQREVVDYFFKTYESGMTPNPCVICNPLVKLKAALEVAERLEADHIATGHYARIRINSQGQPFLLSAVDASKDQSYFLHQTARDSLKRLVLPLGGLLKETVRMIAEEYEIEGLVQEESQDICFLSGDYKMHLKQYAKDMEKPGPIKTSDGKLKGMHRGLSRYTIGQRRGLGIPDKTPYYVVRMEPSTNTLVIGKKEELFQESCRVKKVNWLVDPSRVFSYAVRVKLRSRHKPVRARLEPGHDESGELIIHFEAPQRAVTPGQFAVLYKEALVLGGGVICR